MAQNKKPNIASRLYNRYSLLLLILLVTTMLGGELSISLTGVSLMVWLILLFAGPAIRRFSQKAGIITQPDSVNEDIYKRLMNLILLGVAIVFVAYLVFIHYNNW